MRGAPSTVEKGASAEDRAAVFLQRQGYRIVGRNVRFKCGELDIVAVEAAVLCFVEVRSRWSAAHGHPAETVSRQKQARVSRAAAVYLQGRGRRYREVRFDVVAVTGAVIELLRDAWRL